MSKIAFLDDNTQMGQCYLSHSYEKLSGYIKNSRDSFTECITDGDSLYAYDITVNHPLTKLYGFPCYVVRFILSGVEKAHCVRQEAILQQLCDRLNEKMNQVKGYYNLRVPAHFVDLMRAVNSCLPKLILCGGTVEEIHVSGGDFPGPVDGLELKWADDGLLTVHHDAIQKIAFESFSDFSGQYHISPVTSPKAGEIYKNWVSICFLPGNQDRLMLALFQGKPVGYHLLRESEGFVEGVLISVAEECRGLGIYKALIAEAICYAREQGKNFISSTQLDNYQPQGTWGSLGMRQMYAVYNLHYDNR